MALQMEEMQNERRARNEVLMMMAMHSQGQDSAELEE